MLPPPMMMMMTTMIAGEIGMMVVDVSAVADAAGVDFLIPREPFLGA